MFLLYDISTTDKGSVIHLNMDLDASQVSLGLPMGAAFFPVDVVVNIKVCCSHHLFSYKNGCIL